MLRISKMMKTYFFLADMGLMYVPEMALTVAELMSKQLVNYEKQINKVREQERSDTLGI